MFVLGDAIAIAASAHASQTRWNGEPYILHPLRVMQEVESEAAKMAAVLHDVLEDTSTTLEDLDSAGVPYKVCDAVMLLTHKSGQSYEEYIASLLDDPIAVAVKLADLKDNMDIRQVPYGMRNDKYIQRLKKYMKAHNYLTIRS